MDRAMKVEVGNSCNYLETAPDYSSLFTTTVHIHIQTDVGNRVTRFAVKKAQMDAGNARNIAQPIFCQMIMLIHT
jgi:hypothetical protein